jgi:low temperature requirement protein LtrA
LELFFDLVFVLAMTGITSRLNGPTLPTLSQIAVALGIYALVQWSWVGQAFFDARFDLDDVPHRLLVLVATVGAGAEALGTRQSIDSYLLPIGYLVVRGALILAYVRVYLSDQPARAVVPVYLVGFGSGWLLWLASLALPVMIRPTVWIAAFAVELLTPWIGYKPLVRYPVNISHFPERVGQFTIILLGSTLSNLSDAVPTSNSPVRVIATAGVAFVLPAAIWWVYSTFLTSRLAIPRLGSGRGYFLLHVPFGAAILFLGWALGRTIHRIDAGETELPLVLRLVLGASIVGWMLCGLGLQWFSVGSISPPRAVIASSGVLSITLVALVVTEPALTLILIAAVMIVYAIVVSREISRRAVVSGPAADVGADTD